MFRLTDDEELNAALESGSSSRGRFIKIEKGKKTALRLLSVNAAVGYVHWVRLPDGTSRKVAAAVEVDANGVILNNGWDTDNDPISAMASALFKEAKDLEKSGARKEEVQVVRDRAKNLMPKYEASIVVAEGDVVLVREKGQKFEVAEFDEPKVGILNMSYPQFESLRSLVNSSEYPFLESIEDLLRHNLFISKGDAMNAKWEFSVEEFETEPPAIEEDPDSFDLDQNFVVDEEELERVAKIIELGEMADGDVLGEDDAEYEEEAEGEAEEEPEEDAEEDEPEAAAPVARRGRPSFGARPGASVARRAPVKTQDYRKDLPWETGKVSPYLKPGKAGASKKSAPSVAQRRTAMAKSPAPAKKPAAKTPAKPATKAAPKGATKPGKRARGK